MKKNNKGFSLVELIVVMAIMAILVGAIAPQVVKYVEKSRETKDLQVAATIFTAVQTSISSSKTIVEDITNEDIDGLPATIKNEVIELLGSNLDDDAKILAKCKSSKKGVVSINYVKSTGAITVKIGTLDLITN